MRQGADDSETHERTEALQIRPLPDKERRDQRQRRQIDREQCDDCVRALGAHEVFDGDVVHRRAGGREQDQEQHRIERLAARAHDNEDADKADHDGGPAAEAHIFVQHERRGYCREERRGEIDGGRGRQRHNRDAVKPAQHRDEANDRS